MKARGFLACKNFFDGHLKRMLHMSFLFGLHLNKNTIYSAIMNMWDDPLQSPAVDTTTKFQFRSRSYVFSSLQTTEFVTYFI